MGCPKCGADSRNRIEFACGYRPYKLMQDGSELSELDSIACFERQLAQRTQERDDNLERYRLAHLDWCAESVKSADAEAKLERIRVAAGKWKKSGNYDIMNDLKFVDALDAEFGEGGW